MKYLACGLMLAIIVALSGSPANAADPSTAVQQRCNARTAGQLEDQVHEFQRHPPDDSDLDKGFATLQRLIDDLAQEDGVLEATCTAQGLTPLRGDIRASEALAYLLQSDLAVRKFSTKCPAASKSAGASFVAQAWLQLQRATPEVGPTPGSVTDLIPQTRARAAATGLTLPILSDASSYWVHQLQDAAKQALAACPA